MAEHGFSYENETVKKTRYQIFKDNVAHIKRHNQEGSCWAFSAVAAIESIVAIRSGKLKRLSQQHVLDCNYAHDTCKAGTIDDAFEFVIKNGGLASAIDYPYTAIQGKCSNNKPSSLSVNITSYSVVPQNNEKALLKAVANQPIAVYIDASTFQFYKSGILTGKCGTGLNHGVVMVGYGKEHGVKFWLLKNSWGTGWGENGYMKIKRKVHSKKGMCGIAMIPVYPNA
ncbi:senescence-specific cysteine protease SAG39-like [Salvia hispanica]|uniref:senescence-specific cysteine protease SAG39-like n=1 Tax=Salvia hispanica TaxID=49212 RepID=UPI00200974A0|nr:senescence-specific cysteine protease SAG39-like [Salvia hispanica]